MPEFTIRPIHGLRDLAEVQKLQEDVWGFAPMDVVPLRLMRVMGRNGSMVLGAFDGDDRLLGFVFGYVGVREGKTLLCSHMLGIREEFRDLGIGYALKQAQRDWCLKNRYDVMAWTFDPLESRNARFNLHKLGCHSEEYWVNLYGTVRGGLHGGSATDRFLVIWNLNDPGPNLEGCRAPMVNPPRRGGGGLPDCEDPVIDVEKPRLRALIPRDVQAMKEENLALVKRWRGVIRKVFRTCFRAGYRVVDYDLPESRRLAKYGSYILGKQARGNADPVTPSRW